jgi:hypothetical protein
LKIQTKHRNAFWFSEIQFCAGATQSTRSWWDVVVWVLVWRCGVALWCGVVVWVLVWRCGCGVALWCCGVVLWCGCWWGAVVGWVCLCRLRPLKATQGRRGLGFYTGYFFYRFKLHIINIHKNKKALTFFIALFLGLHRIVSLASPRSVMKPVPLTVTNRPSSSSSSAAASDEFWYT